MHYKGNEKEVAKGKIDTTRDPESREWRYVQRKRDKFRVSTTRGKESMCVQPVKQGDSLFVGL